MTQEEIRQHSREERVTQKEENNMKVPWWQGQQHHYHDDHLHHCLHRHWEKEHCHNIRFHFQALTHYIGSIYAIILYCTDTPLQRSVPVSDTNTHWNSRDTFAVPEQIYFFLQLKHLKPIITCFKSNKQKISFILNLWDIAGDEIGLLLVKFKFFMLLIYNLLNRS